MCFPLALNRQDSEEWTGHEWEGDGPCVQEMTSCQIQSNCIDTKSVHDVNIMLLFPEATRY